MESCITASDAHISVQRHPMGTILGLGVPGSVTILRNTPFPYWTLPVFMRT